jgi:hemolysin activation/secretion protein
MKWLARDRSESGPLRSFFGTACIIAALFAATAHAQGPVPQGSPIPRILQPTPPAVAPAAPPPAAASPSPVPAVTVPVLRITVVGVTAYTASQLAPLLAGLDGPAVPLAKIEAARVALLNRYRDDGFVLTAVTATIDQQKTLTFHVTESHIADVKLDGDIGPAGTLVLRMLRHLTETRPIDVAALERWVLLVQEIPGVTVNTVLRPSTAEPGALTLIAQVHRNLFSALAVIDNAASKTTGPDEGLFVIDGNSFTQFGEKTEVSLYHTSGNTETFGQALEEFFVGSSGLRVRLYGGYGPTTPSAPFRDIGYYGTATVFGVGATYPVIRRREQTLDAIVSFDGVDTRITTLSGLNDAREPLSKDSVRALRLGASYGVQDTLLGDTRAAANTVVFRVSQGLPILGASSSPGSPGARAGEAVSFTKLGAEISRTQTLFEPWGGASVAAVGLVAGQWSGDILPSVEQLYLGGLRLNPGYYSGEVTGDSGVGIYGELQLNDRWAVPLFGEPLDVAAQPFVFGSWGQTWNNTRAQPNVHIASAGGGARLSLAPNAELDVIAAARFTRNINGGDVARLGADTVYWRLILRF